MNDINTQHLTITNENRISWMTYVSNAIKFLDINRNILDNYVLVSIIILSHWVDYPIAQLIRLVIYLVLFLVNQVFVLN